MYTYLGGGRSRRKKKVLFPRHRSIDFLLHPPFAVRQVWNSDSRPPTFSSAHAPDETFMKNRILSHTHTRTGRETEKYIKSFIGRT